MPSITEFCDIDVIYKVAKSILDTLAMKLSEYGVDVPDRRWIGFSDPPEDCCPDLVVWASAPRFWDGDNFDSNLREGRVLCTGLWAVDYQIRFGVCYPQSPNPEPVETLNRASQELYQIGRGLMTWIGALKSGIVPELQPLDTEFRPGILRPFNQGGCAGWEMTITVGLN